MGKGPKVKNKKDKAIKEKVKASPAGTYLVERLVEGVWADGEEMKSPGRKALMKKLGGYDDGRVVPIKPLVRVRAQ